MNERSAYVWLREKVAQPGDRIDRLENLVAEGMPDVNGCFCGTEFWIEIKAPTEPKRSTTTLFGSNHKVSVAQKNWMLRQMKAEGNAYFFINTDKRKMLVSGKLADDLNSMTVNDIVRASLWNSECRTTVDDRDNLRNALIAGF